jgi:hypothetical protein
MRDIAPILSVLSVLALVLVAGGVIALLVVYGAGAYRRAARQLSGWAARNG